MIVADTGSGGDVIDFALGRAQGVGLNGVEKRLNFYTNGRGEMHIESRPRHGTRVEIVLPLEIAATSRDREVLVGREGVR